MKDYFCILEVSSEASIEDIRKAYRRLALIHHPDRGGDVRKMQDINEAYEVLCKRRGADPGVRMEDVMRKAQAQQNNAQEYYWNFQGSGNTTSGPTYEKMRDIWEWINQFDGNFDE